MVQFTHEYSAGSEVPRVLVDQRPAEGDRLVTSRPLRVIPTRGLGEVELRRHDTACQVRLVELSKTLPEEGRGRRRAARVGDRCCARADLIPTVLVRDASAVCVLAAPGLGGGEARCIVRPMRRRGDATRALATTVIVTQNPPFRWPP